MKGRRIIFKIVTVCLGLLTADFAHALTNGLALTPPMGFNSFYSYGPGMNETLFEGVADEMATNGMLTAGYTYLNLDDGWASYRDTNGVIVADTNKFPHGIKALADYVHAKGFKFGLYTVSSTNTCANYLGSGDHVIQDANTYASWGVDYLKYEGCNVSPFEIVTRQQIYAARMKQALANCGRPIVFSLSTSSTFENWMPQYCNLPRGCGDSDGAWSTVLAHIDYVAALAAHAGPGQWNDPDVMEIGSGFFSEVENTSIFTMWCIEAAPLLVLRANSDHTNILANLEAIAVDQDSAGVQGVCVASNNNLQVWSKPLGISNSTTLAVALFNRGDTAAPITANWSDLGLSPGVASIRDLWYRAYTGNFTNSYTTVIPSHGVQFLRLVDNATVPLPPVGTDYLGLLPWLAGITNEIVVSNGDPFYVDLAGSGTPLKLRGTNYTHGLGMNTYTRVSYYLGGIASRFQASVGVDDVAGGAGAIIFRVYLDGIKAYDSGVLTTVSPVQVIDLDLTAHTTLTLEVTNGGLGINNYADWANAQITVLALPPVTPGGLSAAPSVNQIALSWYATIGATSYNLKRSTTPGGPYTTNTTSSVNFLDVGVVPGVTYYYAVSAVNANGESANSPEIAVTLPTYWTNIITTTAQDWNANSNWTNTSAFPNSPGALAVISATIASNQTIDLNQSIQLIALVLGNTNGNGAFTVAANGGALDFAGAQSFLTELSGSTGDTISSPLNYSQSLTITNAATNSLTLSGPCSGAGSLMISGSVLLSGSNSIGGPISISQGILKIGNASALGTANVGITITNGGVLDLNGFDLSAEPVIVSGAGSSNAGAVVNNSAIAQTNGIQFLTLAADTTLGGTSRWDIRGTTNLPGAIATGGNAFNLIKVGTNQIFLANLTVDSTLNNIDVQQGALDLEGAITSLGDSNATLTVETGASLALSNTTASLNKFILLNSDGVTPAIIGLGGSNILAGQIGVIGNAVFNVTSGAVVFNGLLDGFGSLTKNSSGTLRLNGANNLSGGANINSGTLALGNPVALAYMNPILVASNATLDVSPLSSGLTLASGQTLSGGGSITGNLIVGGGASVTTSNSMITFSNSLTFNAGSSCVLEVSHAPLTNDQLKVLGLLTLSGTLVVTNTGSNALTVGDSFKLFNAASYAGAFSSILPITPGPQLLWDTHALADNGTLSIISGTLPHFTNVTFSAGKLIAQGSGGSGSSASYYLLTSTNAAMSVSQWTRIATNQFDVNGNFAFTNNINPNTPASYYRIQMQ